MTSDWRNAHILKQSSAYFYGPKLKNKTYSSYSYLSLENVLVNIDPTWHPKKSKWNRGNIPTLCHEKRQTQQKAFHETKVDVYPQVIRNCHVFNSSPELTSTSWSFSYSAIRQMTIIHRPSHAFSINAYTVVNISPHD